MSILQALIDLIGPVPRGYEIIAWVAASMILLYMVSCIFKIVSELLRVVTGGR
jgi:hypothetical protein